MDNIKTDAQEADIGWYVNVILKHIWFIVAMVLIGLSAAVLANLFMRPVYKAGVLLMIDKEQAGKIDVSPITSFAAEEDYYRTQYKLLESRTLLEKVFKKMKLGEQEEFALGLPAFKKALRVDPIPRSRLVTLEARSYSPQMAADMANTLAEAFVADNIGNRISMAQEVITALESTQKSAQQQELLNSLPQVVNSDFIKSLKMQETELRNQKAKLSSKYTESHPDMMSLNNQIAALQNTINLETKRLIQSIQIDLSGQFSGNNIRIVDRAAAPLFPVRPNKLLNLLIGFATGAVLGVLLSFFLEFFDNSVRSGEDLAGKLGLSFLGFVPVTKADNKSDTEYALMLKEGHFLMPESIRNARTMIDFALTSETGHNFLITGSLQGEGKSHLAANIAVAIAQTGKKILLVDGDLRRSRLHRIFKLSNETGLSNIWLADEKKADFAANIQPVKDVKNLSVMTAGRRPPNPADLLNTPRLGVFIEWASKNYDRVIVDCPAILPLSDTLLWGKYIPRTVFVVRYGKTATSLAAAALEKLNKAGVKVLGAVISQYVPGGLTYNRYRYDKTYYKSEEE